MFLQKPTSYCSSSPLKTPSLLKTNGNSLRDRSVTLMLLAIVAIFLCCNCLAFCNNIYDNVQVAKKHAQESGSSNSTLLPPEVRIHFFSFEEYIDIMGLDPIRLICFVHFSIFHKFIFSNINLYSIFSDRRTLTRLRWGMEYFRRVDFRFFRRNFESFDQFKLVEFYVCLSDILEQISIDY